MGARVSAARIKGIITRAPAIGVVGGLVPAAMRGTIAFDGITFRYPLRPEKCVFKNLSFEAPAGKPCFCASLS